MDVERMKRLLSKGIEAGKQVNEVREVIKTHEARKKDLYDETAEIMKPSIDVQKSVDDKQDKIINQLKENQKAILAGLEDYALVNELLAALPAPPIQEKLPIDYIPKMMYDDDKAKEKPPMESNLDRGFTDEEIDRLIHFKLQPPSKIFTSHLDGSIDFDDYDAAVGKIIKEVGGKKGRLSKTKKSKDENMDQIKDLTNDIKLLQRYRSRLQLIPEGAQTIGKGIYTQKKRNAYKISEKGQYGGLIIDLPKLFSQLKVIAYMNGEKVYDRQADFDTLDLLTKRFNSRRNYSDLSRAVFDDLNRLSEIPIHRTSKKYSKLGSGVVYFNNPDDLISRLNLLGASLMAGNNNMDVKEEFIKIAHVLRNLNVIDQDRLNELVRATVPGTMS